MKRLLGGNVNHKSLFLTLCLVEGFVTTSAVYITTPAIPSCFMTFLSDP